MDVAGCMPLSRAGLDTQGPVRPPTPYSSDLIIVCTCIDLVKMFVFIRIMQYYSITAVQDIKELAIQYWSQQGM